MSAASKSVRRMIYARDRGRCFYCGTLLTFVEATYDHRTPRRQGGASSEANLVLCCLMCNWAKGDRSEQEWLAMPKQEKLSLMQAARLRVKASGL